jgi:hypothetical protein
MDKISLKTLWLSVMLGVLVVTSPTWLNESTHSASHYDAPWMPLQPSQ